MEIASFYRIYTRGKNTYFEIMFYPLWKKLWQRERERERERENSHVREIIS